MKAETSANSPGPESPAGFPENGIGAGYIRARRHRRARRRKRSVILYVLLGCFALGFFVLFFHGNYMRRILVKLGIVRQEEAYAHPADARTVAGWDQCLAQLDVDADVVFFGDSLTHYSDFTAYFPDLTICNFGVDSDTLAGMNQRVYMIQTVKPEKVFLLGGINSLTSDRFSLTVLEYEALLAHMDSVLDADIYVISVLPIAREREIGESGNETITRFNEKIAELARARGMTYLDLAPLFMLDGEMNPDYTIDGVHLTPAGYDVWADAIAEYVR